MYRISGHRSSSLPRNWLSPGPTASLNVLAALAALRGSGWRLQAAGGIGEDEPGHQLARLDHRRVVVFQQLDPAYPAGEELVRRDLEFVLE